MAFKYKKTDDPKWPYQLTDELPVDCREMQAWSVAQGHSCDFQTAFATQDESGFLRVQTGYSWDGPSGPTFDTPDSMRASCVHDNHYQAIRLELLPMSARRVADRMFVRLLKEDGMWWWRRRLWWAALRIGGRGSATAR